MVFETASFDDVSCLLDRVTFSKEANLSLGASGRNEESEFLPLFQSEAKPLESLTGKSS